MILFFSFELYSNPSAALHDGMAGKIGAWKQLNPADSIVEGMLGPTNNTDCSGLRVKEVDECCFLYTNDHYECIVDPQVADFDKTPRPWLADVEKARQQAQMRHQMAADSKSDYSSYLQKFNQEQNDHYFTIIPNIFQKLQDMEERRIERIGMCMKTFADVDRQVLPIVGKCLDGMTK
ncbi:formin-binding protein 1 isoform X1, partial [Lates japonicus]